MWDFNTWALPRLEALERALGAWVPSSAPAGLGDAMRYAVLDGGKRLRPLLALAAAEAVQPAAASPDAGAAPATAGVLRAACAIELIHAYSLVHDDLPCMDNDVLRRGKPTVHVQFGEAPALLAGDALQALAFELLVPEDGSLSDAQSVRLCRLLALAAGHDGMAGGQAIDLAGVGHVLTQAQLEDMHRRKTGAVLLASVLMGATAAGACDAALAALRVYGQTLGLAFQVVDDILDVTADSATLGKTAGKDAANDKPTYVSLLGVARARQLAEEMCQDALDRLAPFGDTGQRLAELTRFIVRRQF